MNILLNFLGNITGINKLLGAMDGKKTYIGGAVLILSGLSAMLAAAGGIAGQLIPIGNVGGLITWIQGLGHNALAGEFLGGFAVLGEGLAKIGLRHALDKTSAETTQPEAPVGSIAGPETKP
jgi:hypothetical protein